MDAKEQKPNLLGELDRGPGSSRTRQQRHDQDSTNDREGGASEILYTYNTINPEYRIEALHKLQKLILTAQALVDETGDKDLHETVVAIATQVANTEAAPG